jgi:hypothetical protein|tara:strand:+ start:296 stop:412 length:117 start_codon:yes stop_codon:yes gene_type:complete
MTTLDQPTLVITGFLKQGKTKDQFQFSPNGLIAKGKLK